MVVLEMVVMVLVEMVEEEVGVVEEEEGIGGQGCIWNLE